MIEPYFFEIPVYRCSRNTHTKELKALESQWTNEEIKETAPESYRTLLYHFHKSIWYTWRYNEIIGWIGLFIFGNQLRADYFKVSAKRIHKGIRKKKFQPPYKLFEKTLPRSKNSSEIFSLIHTQLRELSKHKEFNKRHLDLRTFETIAPYVKWDKLADQLNSFKYPRK